MGCQLTWLGELVQLDEEPPLVFEAEWLAFLVVDRRQEDAECPHGCPTARVVHFDAAIRVLVNAMVFEGAWMMLSNA